MEAVNLFSIASAIVAALFGVLCVLVGWVGNRISSKQDDLMEKLEEVKDDLHARINGIDIRLVRVETLVRDDK